MSKKRILVNDLISRLETGGAILPDNMITEAQAGFWDEYPDGHFYDPANPRLECYLSRLTKENLDTILSDTGIEPGVDFWTLWRQWGRKFYLRSDPVILHNGDEPVLRIRHDSYIQPFGTQGFQNGQDLYGHIFSSSRSALTMAEAMAAITMPLETGGLTEQMWNDTCKLFRRVMLMSFPFEAAGKNTSFHKALHRWPQVFDKFLDEVDSNILHLNIGGMEMHDVYHQIQMQELRDEELVLPMVGRTVRKTGGYNDVVFASLHYSTTGVSLTWRANNYDECYTVTFPEWDCEAYVEELNKLDLRLQKPRGLCEQMYIYQCWMRLSISLLTLMGIGVADEWCPATTYGGMYCAPPALFKQKDLITGVGRLHSYLWGYCSKFKTIDDIKKIYVAP